MNDIPADIFEKIKGFDWDEANVYKNWQRHKVSFLECEEILFNEPLVIAPDHVHSQTEDRYYVLGKTDSGRLLFLVFTIRDDKIRVISARDMNKKERREYLEKT